MFTAEKEKQFWSRSHFAFICRFASDGNERNLFYVFWLVLYAKRNALRNRKCFLCQVVKNGKYEIKRWIGIEFRSFSFFFLLACSSNSTRTFMLHYHILRAWRRVKELSSEWRQKHSLVSMFLVTFDDESSSSVMWTTRTVLFFCKIICNNKLKSVVDSSLSATRKWDPKDKRSLE